MMGGWTPLSAGRNTSCSAGNVSTASRFWSSVVLKRSNRKSSVLHSTHLRSVRIAGNEISTTTQICRRTKSLNLRWLIKDEMNFPNSIIEKMESSYHGFMLFAERTASCNSSGLRGWYVRVLNREGTRIPDDVSAPWISANEAQERGLVLVRIELAKLHEESDDNPHWVATN
jgi:hypothetical protein